MKFVKEKQVEQSGNSQLRKILEWSEGLNIVQTWRTAISERGDSKCQCSRWECDCCIQGRSEGQLWVKRKRVGNEVVEAAGGQDSLQRMEQWIQIFRVKGSAGTHRVPVYRLGWASSKGGNDQEGKMSRSGHLEEYRSGIWKRGGGNETVKRRAIQKYDGQTAFF